MELNLTTNNIYNLSPQLAEGEIAALKRKLVLLEDELERSESKCAVTTAELNDASNRADEISRAIKTLENKNMIDEESEYFVIFCAIQSIN